ncbi:MAG: tetratricopeptide repeat protein [Treponema sp.]|jgi:tetratricopeptide (TPR) repeat protein|nr:tetratricopeptide repeat protein [Treponema sp.]
MPSLSALREFKASFDNAGNEKNILAERNIPFNNLELPDVEAPPMDLGAGGKSAAAVDPAVTAALNPDAAIDPAVAAALNPDAPQSAAASSSPAAPETEPPGGEFAAGADFDFSDLIGSVPNDLPLPDDDFALDTSWPETASSDQDGESPDLGGDDLDLNGDDLNLGDESPDLGGDDLNLDGESPDLGGDDLNLDGESPDLGGEDLNLDGESPDLGGDDLNLSDESLDLGGGDLDLNGEDLNLDGESPDLGGDDLNLDGESPDLGDEDLNLNDESLDLGGEDLDLNGEDLNLGGESAVPGGDDLDLSSADLNLDNDDFRPDDENVDSDGGVFNTDGAETTGVPAGDAFDNFMPGGDVQADADFEAEEGAPVGTDFGDADFSLPGIDDIFSDSEATPSLGSKAKGRGKAKAKQEKAPEDVEEIRLNDEDMERFRKNLAAYPLNLRIACEELIVEQAVAPDQMSALIKLLVNGAPAQETAVLAGQILGRTIEIPKGFEKSTGEALETEQASFAYIFVHNFLPVLRLFAIIAVVTASLGYLIYTFAYIPLKAESIYKIGYERISAGEYERANERFSEAFSIKRKKDWFYRYAEAFRDERQYYHAEAKYDELLRYYPRDKKGVLDYAALETRYLFNYQKADDLLRRELLDYAPNDPDGLLALGDNNLAWGEVDPSKYEDARFAYARLLELYGWTEPVVERMMKYFIRTDNLKEVLPLQAWFASNAKRKLSADSLAELGGYLLDKQLEEVRGVPNEYVEQIDGIRDLLLEAVRTDPSLPEAHYHLARYYHTLGDTRDERVTLETAIQAFEAAPEESVRRLTRRIDAYRRYADVLINNREFVPAGEQLVKGINLYEDALARRLMVRSPEYGRLYAGLGDLEYFTKTADMEAALNYYHRAEQNGWAPPEMQYRMGAAYYQLEDWRNALEYLFTASSALPLNRRLLFALGNAALKRGDYFAAQGYYNRLLDILETQRARLPVLLPNDRPEYLELAERLMMARNNAGVACEALADETGARRYRTRAQALYAEANRAWDSLTRDPRTMIRSGSIPLPYLNSRNTLYPQVEYEPQIFIRIDRDVSEPSKWEELAPLAGFAG